MLEGKKRVITQEFLIKVTHTITRQNQKIMVSYIREAIYEKYPHLEERLGGRDNRVTIKML